MKKTASLLALACVIAMTGCTPKEEVTEEKTARHCPDSGSNYRGYFQ